MQSIQTHPSTYAIVTLERMRNSRHMARTPYTTSILTMALRKIGNEALYARLNPPRMFPYHPLIPIPYLPLPSPWPRPWPKLQTKPHNHGFFRNVSLPHKREREIETPNTCIGHQEAPEMGAWSAVARSLPVLSPPWLQPPSYHHKATISEFSKHPPSHRKGKKNPRFAERVPTVEPNKLEHVPQEQNPRATPKLPLLVRHSCNGHQPVTTAQGTGTDRLRPREMS